MGFLHGLGAVKNSRTINWGIKLAPWRPSFLRAKKKIRDEDVNPDEDDEYWSSIDSSQVVLDEDDVFARGHFTHKYVVWGKQGDEGDAEMRTRYNLQHMRWGRITSRIQDAKAMVRRDISILSEDLSSIDGSFYVFEGNSSNDVLRLLEYDPFVAYGLFHEVSIYCWKQLEDPDLKMLQMEPPFVFIGFDHPNSLETRLENRPKHLEHMKASGRVLAAGPIFDIENEDNLDKPIGSFVLFQGQSIDEIQEVVAEDPYTKANLFKTTLLRRCNFLDATGYHSLGLMKAKEPLVYEDPLEAAVEARSIENLGIMEQADAEDENV